MRISLPGISYQEEDGYNFFAEPSFILKTVQVMTDPYGNNAIIYYSTLDNSDHPPKVYHTGGNGIDITIDRIDLNKYTIKIDSVPVTFYLRAAVQYGVYFPAQQTGYQILDVNDNIISQTDALIERKDTLKFKLNLLPGYVSPVVTVNGNTTLTPDAQGVYSIDSITQDYTVDVSLTSIPAITDLVFDLSSQTYDGTAKSISVTAQSSITGMGAITVKYDGNTDEPINAGMYEITVDIAEGTHYTDTVGMVLGDFIIGKAPLNIRPQDTLRYVGETNPAFTLAFSGLQAGDNENSFGTISVITTATIASPAGTYHIIASGAVNDNYNISYTNGILTVVGINTDITSISVDGEQAARSGDDFYVIAGCGNNSVTVFVSADISATVSINGVQQNSVTVPLPDNGDNIVSIEVKAQNGATANYTLTINKPIPFNQVVKMRWNNTLTAINNADNNGGYRFTSYKWYCNGQQISTEQSWSVGKDGQLLNPADVYHVVLIAEGVSSELRTCQSSITLKSVDIKAYPNPVRNGQTLYVQVDLEEELLKDAVLEIYNAFGGKVGQMNVQGRFTPVGIHYTTGAHLFVLKTKDGFTRELKIVISD